MLKIDGNIWIEGKGGAFMGKGRLQLLEKIKEHGSISEAARSIQMSYKKAWEMIDSMNRQSKKPMVIKVSGGKGGGGTVVTKEGNDAIQTYKAVLASFKKFCESNAKSLS